MAFVNTIVSWLTIQHVLDKPSGFPWELILLHGLDFVQNFGLRILLFAVLLKVLLSPLDVYSRYKMRKNARITLALKDRLADLKRQYADDRMEYQRREMAMKRQEGFSLFGSCLPIIVSLILSIWIWGSVRGMSEYGNMRQYLELYDVYQREMAIAPEDSKYDANSPTERAQQAVFEYFQNNRQLDSFLWIKNIWSSDTPWTSAIPDNLNSAGKFARDNLITVQELDKDGNVTKSYKLDDSEFNDLLARYDVVTKMIRNDPSNNTNGLLILILFSSGAMFLSQLLVQRAQKAGQSMSVNTDSPFANALQNNMKVMIYIMPAIMAFFMLLQPAAFTLYIGIGSVTTTIISLTSTQIMKSFEKHHERELVTKVQKYGRPDPKELFNIQDIEFDKQDSSTSQDKKE
ncbi:MAG: YidC/Oxa1 family membrane protein insertase [Clostridiales bacterium]|jgi:YidC/Oxa1 family membrane protein insertase|nr:YidC/Oxa1 family membrane protein insertase [Clostridiales bacterium]